MHGKATGFSLIELLIVVAVIGVLAGIAIPTLLSAVHRGKQKRTMADVRAIAVAMESYASDNDAFPDLTPQGPVSAVLPLLQPTYMHSVPRLDAWGRDVLYEGGGEEYTLVSLGRDGAVSGPPSGPTTDFDDDLIFVMGSFVTWPAGVQD
jgi:type II secretion system protein G